MIYTSYYNKRTKGEGKYIAISRSFPVWLNKEEYTHLPCVSPSVQLREKYKNNEIDFQTFIEEFRKELSPEQMQKLLDEIPEHGDCYILCHEKDVNTCHRWLIKYILNKIGKECKEYD